MNIINHDIKLYEEIKDLIEQSRSFMASTVNSALTLLYWNIGKKIFENILNSERAEYGDKIVLTLSRQLEDEYGRGFSYKSVRHMIQFAKIFDNHEIVSTLSRQLSWSHFLELIYQKESLAIEFYSEMCRIEKWSVRTLRNKISSKLFERTIISKKSDELIRTELQAIRKTDKLTPDIILKDPYLLDFLKLNDRYLEKDLEDAILRELEQFILELGAGFTFIARQKRIQLDNNDFYIDLLFYNRKLKRLVAIELKLDDFKAEYKGQMELYLRYLAKYEMEENENPPIGIILCSGKKQEQIELLELDKSSIHVAEYLTILPPKEIFEHKLQQVIEIAKKRINNR